MTDLERAWHPWTGEFRLALAFRQGMNELNALFPTRPQGAQEGTVGDFAHRTETGGSDHNPNQAGVVRAWDIQTEDAPFDAQALADYLAAGIRSRTLKFFGAKGYVIYNRRITPWSPLGLPWQPYTGKDPHDRHIHVSLGTLSSEYDNTQVWGLAQAFNPKHAGGSAAVIIAQAIKEDGMVIVTPGKTPLPMVLDGGTAVGLKSGTSWHNLAAAGIKTVQIDPVDYAAFRKAYR